MINKQLATALKNIASLMAPLRAYQLMRALLLENINFDRSFRTVFSKNVKAIITSFVLFFLFQVNLFSQVSVKNQTFSAFGSAISQNVEGVRIQQSIGQSSVIGNFLSSEVNINQGFLQGLSSGIKYSPESIKLIPFPNPFKNRITFRFIPGVSEEVVLSIYDMYGRGVSKGQFIVLNNELTIDLDHLSNALYLVFFRSGNQIFQTRIIKTL